ncbi:MAG: hypothetical protein WCF84_11500 [Anaerolineae bacterium]
MKLERELEQLQQAQLIRRLPDEDLTYLFKHALTQDAAYESLLLKKRREIHRHVAQAYEQLDPEHLDELAAVLAQHYAEAGDDARTLEYLIRAGDAAGRLQANVEAIARYTQALEVAARMPPAPDKLLHLYTRRGRALELTGDYDRALANYDEMALLARRHNERALELAALMASATVYSAPTARFDPPHAQALAEQTLALAQELDDRAASAKILWNLMLLNYFTGRLPESLAYGEQSLALAREFNLREQLAYTLNDIGRVYQVLGQSERANAAADAAHALWQELDNKPMLVDSLRNTALRYSQTGEFDQVLKNSDEAYRLSESIGSLWGQSYSRMGTGYIYWGRGQIEQAIQRMEECFRLADQAGFLVAAASERAALGELYATMGDLERGFALVHAAWDKGQAMPSSSSALTAMFARLHTLAGDLEQAESDLQRSYLAASQTNMPLGKGFTWLADLELSLAKSDYPRALRVADELLTLLKQHGIRIYIIGALWYKGRALAGQGRTDDALATLADARAEAQALGTRRTLWEILALSADLEQQRGNESAAAALHAQARETVEFIAAHTPDDLRRAFLNLPQVQHALRDR